jgi:solute carrier family 25 citrate transporter 1
MRGFLHASTIIAKERGIRGFFQGFVPTTARQAANSATRFGSYSTLKHLAEGYVAPGEKLGSAGVFAIGGTAGLITVYECFRSATQGWDSLSDSFFYCQICDTAVGYH